MPETQRKTEVLMKRLRLNHISGNTPHGYKASRKQLLRRRASRWRNTLYETPVKRANLKLNVDHTLRKPSSRTGEIAQ